MNCHYCRNACVKSGVRKGVQRYQCKVCKRNMQAIYTKPRIPQEKYEWTVKLNNEGCGISNIARLLKISKSSVQRVIERIAANLQMPQWKAIKWRGCFGLLSQHTRTHTHPSQ